MINLLPIAFLSRKVQPAYARVEDGVGPVLDVLCGGKLFSILDVEDSLQSCRSRSCTTVYKSKLPITSKNAQKDMGSHDAAAAPGAPMYKHFVAIANFNDCIDGIMQSLWRLR